jgi:hypothetical protein
LDEYALLSHYTISEIQTTLMQLLSGANRSASTEEFILAVKENRTMQNHGIRFVSTILVSFLILGGCQSDLTVSTAVRKGDTVVVSLGDADPNGAYSNVTSTLLRESDISAKILDSGWILNPVKVRHVFRVYGDPTAVSGKARGQAQWMAVIDLVHPVNNTKPNLALGNAALVLESAKFKDNQVIKTEILNGSGTPHPFVSQNEPTELGIDKLTFVKPAKQALVRVSGTLPQGVKLAGAEYEFDIPAVHTLNILAERVEAVAPAKLPANQQVYFEFRRNERQAPVGTEVLVALTSTDGVDQANLSAFDFVMTSDQEAISNTPNYWQSKLMRATFYSTEGEEIAGLTGSVGSNE